MEAGAAAVVRKAMEVATAAAAEAGAPLQRGPSQRGRGRRGPGGFKGTECSGECSHGIAQECAAKDSDCDYIRFVCGLPCRPRGCCQMVMLSVRAYGR